MDRHRSRAERAAAAAALLLAAAASACEPIQPELCRDMGYNMTSMPNLVGHELQRDAELTLQTFQPLIQYGCSPHLRVFLCSVFVPMCTDKVPFPIGPCRGLCDAVKAHCFPVLRGFGFPWPALLNCSKFPPVNNHETMCMEGPPEPMPAPPPPPLLRPPALAPPPAPGPGPGLAAAPAAADPCARLARPELHVLVNRSGRCVARCDADVLFDAADKRLAAAWLALWAVLCFSSSLLAVLTFLVDAQQARFRYPERPLAFLALCYNLAAVGWGVLALAGRDAVACAAADPRGRPGPALLAGDGLASANCAVVFLLLYYFGTAAAVWWTVLCGAWFAAAALRWPHERTQRHSPLFHLAGWGAPAALAIAVLVLRAVDADELTGACYVGAQNSRALLAFVLAPQAAFLLLGCSLLAAGFAALLRTPGVGAAPAPAGPPPPPPPPDLLRLGTLAVLCALPAACVVAGHAYEYAWRPAWLLRAPPGQPQPRPLLWVFLVRLFMSLVVGVTSAFWVWSPKTLRAWRRFFRRLGPSSAAAAAAGYKQAPPGPGKCAAAGAAPAAAAPAYPPHCYSHQPLLPPPPPHLQPLRAPHKHRSKHRSTPGNETTV